VTINCLVRRTDRQHRAAFDALPGCSHRIQSKFCLRSSAMIRADAFVRSARPCPVWGTSGQQRKILAGRFVADQCLL